MNLMTRIGRTVKKHPAAFCCRVLMCLPLLLIQAIKDLLSYEK